MLIDFVEPSGEIPHPGRSEKANPLVQKLAQFADLHSTDIARLNKLCALRKFFNASEVLIQQCQRSRFVFLIISGIGYRYKYLPDGRRQILGYLLPGDLCDTQFLVSEGCDHFVGLLTDAEVAIIALNDLRTLISISQAIRQALNQVALVEGATLREWLLNVGQRGGIERIAHFLCEFSLRLNSIEDLGREGSFAMPLTQQELADTMGMTVVHVNRCLQRLRSDNLIVWERRRLTLIDRERLERIAGFDGAYMMPSERLRVAAELEVA